MPEEQTEPVVKVGDKFTYETEKKFRDFLKLHKVKAHSIETVNGARIVTVWVI
jgi:hypothetical protein